MKDNSPLAELARNSPFAWVYKFDGSGGAEQLSEPASSFNSETGKGFIWVHVTLTDPRARSWINDLSILPEGAKALLLDNDEHACLHGEDGAIWGTLPDFAREPGETTDRFVKIRLFVGHNIVLTARRRSVQCALTTRQAVDAGKKFARPTDLLEALVINIIAAIEESAERAISGVNKIEDEILDDAAKDQRRKLGPLRRVAVALHRQTTTLQRVLARFDDPERLTEAAHGCLRRLLQRLESVHHELHSTLERARLLHEEVDSTLTSDTNRQLYILTIISTLMLPPTFVTGLFGMNVKGLLFADDENGFVYAITMCAAAALAAYGILFFLGRASKAGGRA